MVFIGMTVGCECGVLFGGGFAAAKQNLSTRWICHSDAKQRNPAFGFAEIEFLSS